MHKATYEQVYGKPYELDERDRALLAERTAARVRLQGPLVGDFLITSEGKLRFTHDWGDTIQTTVRPGYDSSFYIDRTGYMSFSGSLAPGIARDTIEPTGETEEGTCWFFSHDYATAHNGVHVTVPCRVYRMKEEDKRRTA